MEVQGVQGCFGGLDVFRVRGPPGFLEIVFNCHIGKLVESLGYRVEGLRV